jgi:hypothetical protein
MLPKGGVASKGHQCTVTQVEETKAFVRIMPIFLGAPGPPRGGGGAASCRLRSCCARLRAAARQLAACGACSHLIIPPGPTCTHLYPSHTAL